MSFRNHNNENAKISAIDIGSNSLKLVIVEAAAADSFITVLLQDRERVGLDTKRSRITFCPLQR